MLQRSRSLVNTATILLGILDLGLFAEGRLR
jgi:hypothetical protein